MTKTDEGYLICHDVPINRIGVQDYVGDEIGINDNNMHKVLRRPEEVFSPPALASFEGKAITDGHPPKAVIPENIQFYGKGHAQNIRKGSGKNAGTSIADLFITDPQLIREVQNGKRDISCGYTYDLVPNKNGTFEQRNIRGNHIAVVDEGRAGHRVSIKDEKPKNNERGNTMANEEKKNFRGWLMKLVAKDESTTPEDLEKLSKMKEPEAKDELPENKIDSETTEKPKPEVKPGIKPEAKDESPTDELLKQVISMLGELKSSLAPKESDDELEDLIDPKHEAEETPQEEAEEHATGKEDESTEEQEPSVTIPAEEITKTEKPAAMDEMRRTAAITQGILRKTIKDPKAYKMAAKDAATELRRQFNIPKDNSGYSDFIHGTSQAAKTRIAHDAAARKEKELADVQKMYDSMNPHNKEAK
jgi:hypothetical protein